MKRNGKLGFFTIVIFMSSFGSINSAQKPAQKTTFNPIIHKLIEYSLPESRMNGPAINNPDMRNSSMSLGGREVTTSPGAVIDNSYFDLQHYNTMGRMIGTGTYISGSDSIGLIQFAWMDLNGQDPSIRGSVSFTCASGYGDVFYSTDFGHWGATGGFVSLDVTPDGRAVVSAHWNSTGNADAYMPFVWYDAAPCDQGFPNLSIPTAPYEMLPPPPYAEEGRRLMFPKVAFQTKPDGSHVTHLAAIAYDDNSILSYPFVYYRKEGTSSTQIHDGGVTFCTNPTDPDWDCPVIFDTGWTTAALVTASKQSGKVSLTWVANRPDYDAFPGCDTCSNNNDLGTLTNLYDNDVYYRLSDDYGVTWNPRVNVTLVEDEDEWRPHNDITALFTGDAPNEELHIAWNASNWDKYESSGYMGYGARIFHWAESFGVGNGLPRPAATSRLDPIMCNAGQYDLNLSKPQISECNGNIYILFVNLWDGHDDPLNPDCSERGYNGDPNSSVNGELALVISDNNGLSFDLPHNLTNSPTPQCDPSGAVLDCDSDHWPSSTPHGYTTTSADDWSQLTHVNPRPAQIYNDVPGVAWLPVMYINDKDPGFLAIDNSTWQNNPVKSFLMACVGPDQISGVPELCGYDNKIGWPTNTPPGEQLDIMRVFENTGNADINYILNVEEQSGPSGWLTVSGYSGFIAHGFLNRDTGYIHLNTGGIIDSPATVSGHIEILNLSNSDVCTLFVTLHVVEGGIQSYGFDTISTGKLSLVVMNTGQFGGGPGVANNEGTHLDYFNDPAECDTVDSIPGETNMYIYDGSIIVGSIVNGDTIMSTQIYSQGFQDNWAIYPLENKVGPTIDGVVQTWNSGTLVNHDTSIAMEITYYAPQVTQTWNFGPGKIWHADQQFITREFKVWSYNGQVHENIVVGEAIDWDIPSDSGNRNAGEVDTTRNLLYCIGAEFDQDSGVECQDNNERYGGSAFGYFKKFDAASSSWTIVDSTGYGGYHESNARYVYPGWKAGELYANMSYCGYFDWVPPIPDSAQIDLHSVSTYAFDYDLMPNDTLVFYSVLATVRNNEEEDPGAGLLRIQELADKGRNFVHYFGCCHGIKGDANNDGADANILDLNQLVNYFFRAGVKSTCGGESDANSDGKYNVLDLNYLVNYIFRMGPAPLSCGQPPQ